MKLSPFDLATAPLDAGTTLLEASAGTGKTYALVGLLLRLLLERRIDRLDEALVVTFTVAATEELKNRMRDALVATLRAIDDGSGDPFVRELARRPGARALLRRALDDFDRVGIATMHGFCKRLLEEAAFETHSPFALDFTVDALPLLHRAAADALRSQYDPAVNARTALLHDTTLVPGDLVAQYRLWRRNPDVRLEPEHPDPAPHLAALDAAVQEAARRWDADAAARLAKLNWLKGKQPFAGDPAAAGEVLGERLRRAPHATLGLLRQLAPSVAARLLRKNETRHLAHPFFEACDAVEAAADLAFRHLRADLLARMHARLHEHKRDEHVLTFDDLLQRAHDALQDPVRAAVLLPAVRARYRVALIDEFQDTDTLQYDVFAKCFQDRALFLVGDPKQSIYAFRGADLRSYLRARKDAIRRFTLTTNWRSGETLVRAVDDLFARVGSFAHPDLDMPTVTAAAPNAGLTVDGDPGAPLRFRFVQLADDDPQPWLPRALGEDRIVADVAAEISRLLRGDARIDGERVRASDCAVLTRTNRQATAVQAALREAAIPSSIGKAGDIFQTDELAELELLLLAVLVPNNVARLRAAMATRLWGDDCAKLLALPDDDRALDSDIERLDQWRRTWLRRGVVTMMEQVFIGLRVHKRFLSLQGGERRLTNLRQLIELLHAAEHDGRLSPEGLLEWLQRERANQEEIDYALRELRLESDGDAVQILTVHGSKGLEYEIVFCPFLWDGAKPRRNEVVPDANGTAHELALDMTKDDPAMLRAQAERLAEDLRLAYVALTRARRRCYVHWGPIGSAQAGAWRSALGWLLAPALPAPEDGPAGDATGAWVERFQDATKSDVAAWLDHLQRRCAGSRGALGLEIVPFAPAPVRIAPQPLPPLPPARRAERRPRERGVFSYSSLIASGTAPEPRPDRDDRAAAREAQAPSRGIFAFARGPAAGQCLHHVLEHVDFAQLAAPATAETVRAALDSFALLAPEAHAGDLDPVGDVVQNLRDLAAARVHADGPTLRALCAGHRAVEWEFTLPAHDASPRQLAHVFARSSSAIARAQAERLARLPEGALRGFLVGFVDLLAEHGGRHWVVDWKSNHLGDAAADYGPEALQAAMVEHDYVLQYHLYVLALHRQLRARLRDYDYERHVGGVCYAFLRGAVPDTACGMFFDRVPQDLVLAMHDWLEGRGHGGAP